MHWLLTLIVLFVSYGSLYPFSFDVDLVTEGSIRHFLTDFPTWSDRGNVIANSILFMPYGFVAVLATLRGACPRALLAFYLLLGLALALILQAAQLLIVGRNPSIGDAIINSAGMLAGTVIGFALASSMRSGAATRKKSELLIPLGLATLWLAYRWFPLVPALDVQNIKDGLKPLFLSPQLDVSRLLASATGWVAWTVILLRLRVPWVNRLTIACAAVAVVAFQPFFVSNTISVANVAGLAIALALLPAMRHHEAVTLAIVGLLLSLLVSGMHPFTLADPRNDFLFLPMAGYLGGSMEVNAMNLILKSYLYGALVYLLHKNGAGWGSAGLVVALWLAMIEVAQIWIATRTPEITDPLLALLIAHVMSRLDRHTTLDEKRSAVRHFRPER